MTTQNKRPSARELFSNCTKEELLFLLDNCAKQNPWRNMLQRAKCDLLYDQQKQCLDEMDKVNERAKGTNRLEWFKAMNKWEILNKKCDKIHKLWVSALEEKTNHDAH
jgi:hypothetical protein